MKKYDVCFGEKYTTSNGEEKTKWSRHGAVISTKNGFALKLESVPVNFNGWFSLFEPKSDNQQQPRQDVTTKQEPTQPSFDDDIPFMSHMKTMEYYI